MIENFLLMAQNKMKKERLKEDTQICQEIDDKFWTFFPPEIGSKQISFSYSFTERGKTVLQSLFCLILFLFYRRDGGRFATLDIGTDPYTKDSPSFNTRAERETSKW